MRFFYAPGARSPSRFHVGLTLIGGLALSACGGGGSQAPVDPPASTVVQLKVDRVFAGISFESPVAMLQAPADDTRWYVVEQGGKERPVGMVLGVLLVGLERELP